MKDNKLGAVLWLAVFLSVGGPMSAEDPTGGRPGKYGPDPDTVGNAGFPAHDGQDVDVNEENKRKINQIKLDTVSYICEESVQFTREEAEAAAAITFRRALEQWREQQDSSRLRPLGDLDDFVRNCRKISALRGGGAYVRILIYVPKSELRLPPTPGMPVEDSTGTLSAEAAAVRAALIGKLLRRNTIKEAVDLLRQRRVSSSKFYDFGEVGYDTDLELTGRSLLLVYDGDDEGRIRALLDARRSDSSHSSARLNLGTGLKDSTANYPGCRAKWILFRQKRK